MRMLFDRLYDYTTNTTNLQPEAAAMPQVCQRPDLHHQLRPA